jgi:toxin HigB-1
MIVSFASQATEKLFACERVPQFVNIEVVALRKLAMLNRVKRIEELRIPPNNRLEALKGNRVGTHSIRINDQFRICFRFESGDAHDVEIVDYH